ncbi:MAG: hypothetical protein SPK43_03540 [Candidatus Onthovivens sp.]|nr:hypothetical protein [Candidatus Onthovivens sp.]
MNTDGIIYIPQSDTYRIKVGKRIAEIPARTFKRSWNVRWAESVLKGTNDAAKKDLLDVILNFGGRLIHDSLDNTNANNNEKLHSSAWDSLARKLEQADIIDALYRGAIDPRDTVVACMDLPKPTPYYDPSAAPTVYYNDRFPSVPAQTIIEEAIKLLEAKKNLHMTKISVDQIFEGFKILIRSDMPFVSGSEKTLIVVIKHAAFDRAKRTDIDKFAGLKAKLDTDTYIKLRIAFLLYEVLKADGCNKPNIDSDLCNVICFG